MSFRQFQGDADIISMHKNHTGLLLATLISLSERPLKPSKKKTYEVGAIGHYCRVGDGAHASIGRVATGVMYLTSKNFKPTGLDLSHVDFIAETDFEKYFSESKSALTSPRSGDVLLGIIGSLGTPYVVKPSDKFGLSSSVAIIRPGEAIDSRFLYYFMTSAHFQSAVNAIKSGVAQGFLSLAMIRSLPLVVPSIQVQRKIASILSAYDDLIENNKRRIAILEEMTEEIYREWFVRMRFPASAKATAGKPVISNDSNFWGPGQRVPINRLVKFLSGYSF
jgi:type I restriction enzyme S subunit